MKKAELLGRLTADPELKQFTNSTMCTFTLVDKVTVKGQEQTDFTDVKCWGKQAEFAAQFFKKGKRVYVSGALTYEVYNDRDGKKRKAVLVTAEHLEFADGAEPTEKGEE